jgi:hypothetical protein
MHSPLAREMAQARARELRAMARPGVRRTARAEGRVGGWHPRQRAGWWLVTVGLRLATGSPEVLR